MPYFNYCIRCNKDGSYQYLNNDCPKCDGTGNSWREDNELENYHKWAGLKLDDLRREKSLISKDGIAFFYRERIPSVEEEKRELRLINESPKNWLKEKYDYYIEPCQLCISRNGSTYDSCGWCHDDDTHYKQSDGTYSGDWVIIPYKGYGYPFHELPHPTRKYYKDKNYIEGSDGLIPTDVSNYYIKEAHGRNAAVSGLQDLLQSGVKRTLNIDKKHIEKFITDIYIIANQTWNIETDGKLDFRFLAYTTSNSLADDVEKINIIKDVIYNNPQQWLQVTNSQKYRKFSETLIHESFHILQAITTNSVGIMFDAGRRLSVLKWMLLEDFFLDRQGEVPFGADVYDLLNHVDEKTELYHYISRNFDYCRGDVEIIKKYSHTSQNFNVNMFDLIEGGAFVFQEYLLNNNVTVQDIFDKRVELGIPNTVYVNALQHYADCGGNDLIEFSLFCYCALKIGLIVDEEDLVDSPSNPVSLFGYLCSLKKEQPDFLEYNGFRNVSSFFEVQDFLDRIGYSINNEFMNYLKNEDIDKIIPFLSNALKYQKIHTEVFTFLKYIGLNKTEYKNLEKLLDCLQKSCSGQANERLESVKKDVFEELSFVDNDIIISFLLSFNLSAFKLLLKINNITNNARYIGAFGEEEVTTSCENITIDIIERVSDYMFDRANIFCCDKHGIVLHKKIMFCQEQNGLNNIVQKRFEKKLTEMITDIDTISYTKLGD